MLGIPAQQNLPLAEDLRLFKTLSIGMTLALKSTARLEVSMKILIAYDGSKCADAALDDLTHAGLPEKGEALVMSVAEVWLPPPPPSSYEVVEMATTAKGALGLERNYMASAQVVKDADEMAAKAAVQFRANFPN